MEAFDNKVIWIVGASSGYGEALAYEFSSRGAKLILSARREDELERVKKKVDEATVIPMDMLAPNTFAGCTQRAIAAYGKIDILILNAGVAQNASALETTVEAQRKIMDIDFFSYTALTQCVLPHMMENKEGRIVVTSGLLARLGLPNRSTYSAAKAALHGYFNCLRTEMTAYNIGVTILVPGALQTSLTSKAIGADGKIAGKDALGVGCDLNVATQQAAEAIAAGIHETYIGIEDASYQLYSLAGNDPNKAAEMIVNQFKHI